MWNTFRFAIISVSIETVLGLMVALVLNAEFVGRSIVRAAILIPWAIPTIVSAKLWAWMFNDQFGMINDILLRLGLISQKIAWTANVDTAFYAVLIVDIDFFKAINDGHGHDAGDDVLREFAIRIRKSIRNIDLACRYGGEEFVIVMPETDMAVATMVAERLRRRIATEPFPIQQGARTLDVTISIGIASLNSSEDTPAQMLKRADQALYRAKRDGRNRVVQDAA